MHLTGQVEQIRKARTIRVLIFIYCLSFWLKSAKSCATSRTGATLILSSAVCWWQAFLFEVLQECVVCSESLLTRKIVCSAFTAFPLGHNTWKKGSLKVPVFGFRCDSGLVNI